MRLLSALLLTSALLAAFPAFSQQSVHQHGYREINHDTYPPEMMKSYIRVQNWLEDAQNQVGGLMTATHPRVVAWRNAILAVPMDDDLAMLNRINAITNNHVTYVDDFNRNSGDKWATPIETLVRGGDCEDIALLKAMALHLKGWDTKGSNSMRLLIGLLNHGNVSVPHAVLEVDAPNNQHYVMHNLTPDVLTFDEMNMKMKPLYMVDSTGVIAFTKPRYSLSHLAATAGARDGETTPIMWDTPSRHN